MTHPRRPPLHRILACLLALVGLVAPLGADEGDAPLRPQDDDVEIRRDAALAKGTWRVADGNGNGVLRVTTDGVTLDLRGAALVGAPRGARPDAYTGIGIHVVGAKNVTIRGGAVRGFKVGIRAERAPGLKVLDVDASENFRQHLGSTPEREDPADWLWPHHNDAGEWEARYGAAIALSDCRDAVVARCLAQQGQNGLLLTRCVDCEVYDNDFSFNSGWGIALYRSNRCVVSRNACNWCVRGYSHGVYHRGQDSAGILVFEQCRDNVFARNAATHGGDGFFLYAGHETTQRTGGGGCNRNVVIENDFSHAVANGIEATFSTENVFAHNDCSDCDHGVWAGYSSNTLIAGNKIEGCLTAGVSIEHGQHNRIVANRITDAPVGVHLWWDRDEAFLKGAFGKKRDTSSSANVIQGNVIRNCATAVRLVRDEGTDLSWNELHGREVLLDLGAGTTPGDVRDNQFQGTRLRSRRPPLAVRDGSGSGWVPPDRNQRRGRLRGEGVFDPMAWPASPGFVRPRLALPETPEVPGARDARLPAEMPRGRAQIRVDEWGPLDPRLPHAFPRHLQPGGPRGRVQLSGVGDFRVRPVEGEVEVAPRAGRLPAALDVRVLPLPGDAPRSSLVPFKLAIEAGGTPLVVEGTLLDVRWQVAWFTWEVDPREDEAAFARLLAGEPARRAEVETLDLPWRGGGPEGVRPDRFATRAETVLRLPAGRYRVRTVSDDGIRVWIGERRVIDNWTHHAPTEDVAQVDLAAGDHVVRVEHFEIDGWAQLSFRIEALP